MEGVEKKKSVIRWKEEIEIGWIEVMDKIVRVKKEGVEIGKKIGRKKEEEIEKRKIGIRKRKDRKIVEIIVVEEKWKIEELIIGRKEKKKWIEILKLRRKKRKLRDLSREEEGEVIRVKENEFKIEGEDMLSKLIEWRKEVLLMMVEKGI